LPNEVYVDKFRCQNASNALRAAVNTGIEALENGDYIEFKSVSELVEYLRSLSLDIDPNASNA